MDPEVFPDKNEKKTAKNLFQPPIPVTSYEIKLTHVFFVKILVRNFPVRVLLNVCGENT